VLPRSPQIIIDYRKSAHRAGSSREGSAVCILALYKPSDNSSDILTKLNHFILPKTAVQIAKAAYLFAEVRMSMFVVAYLIKFFTGIEWMM